MKGIQVFCEDVRTGFKEFGISFLPRLLLFPFMLVALIVLTVVNDRLIVPIRMRR